MSLVGILLRHGLLEQQDAILSKVAAGGRQAVHRTLRAVPVPMTDLLYRVMINDNVFFFPLSSFRWSDLLY